MMATLTLDPDRERVERLETAQAMRLVNALTVDVEDWFHVSGFDSRIKREDWDGFAPRIQIGTEAILDILDRAGVRGTFFVLGWVAERMPSMVRAIRDAGHEIGCHSYAHRLIYQMTPAEFRADTRRAIDAIEDAIGERVDLYRAPSFSITAQSEWALGILAGEGIRVDSSIYPVRHDRYGMPGASLEPHRIGSLWEYPPPVCPLWGWNAPVGGGGYLRLYPYAVTRWMLQRINAAGRPFAAYVHPWELDPEQPRVSCGWKQRFRHYVGLRRTASRLAKLCRDFPFGTLSESLAGFCPSARPKRRLAA
ncbi:MAG: DUF3473 domain-containing protein [Gemmataceae bacterium]|nr:DUF3473 domain-containing protein [Gemmataceae bacterium]